MKDLYVTGKNSSLANAINFYFEKKLFTSPSDFYEKQKYNAKLANVYQEKTGNYLANKVDVNGLIFKRNILPFSAFNQGTKYHLDKTFSELEGGKYLIYLSYLKKNKIIKYFCVHKKNDKIFVISEENGLSETISEIGYKLNQEPNIDEKNIKLRKSYKICNLIIWNYNLDF